MSDAVSNLLSQSVEQWETIRELMEVGSHVSQKTRDKISSQVETAATQCLQVARTMTPDAPDRVMADKLEQTLIGIASTSDEGRLVANRRSASLR